MSVIDKVKNFFGSGEDIYEEVECVEVEQEQPVKIVNSRANRQNSNQGNIVNFKGRYEANGSKLIVYRPVSYEDVNNVIQYLKNDQPIIVNMEKLNKEVAQRILDVIYGAICAVDGKLYKVNGRIFIASPAGCDVVGSGIVY